MAWPSPRESSRLAAAPRRTPRSSPARSASPASRAARSSSWTMPTGTARIARTPAPRSRRATGSASMARPATSSPGSLATVSARYEEQADLQRILGWADAIRRLGVWTNADKPEEAAQARSYGAEGIGLCRTEHMFREGERLEIVRGAITHRGRGDPREGEAGGRRGARRRRGGDRHPLRRRDGRARGAAAGRLRGHLPRDGWPAGRHPVDRSAAPRVPARTSRSSSSRSRRPGTPRAPRTASCWPRSARCTSRTRCSACGACAWA